MKTTSFIRLLARRCKPYRTRDKRNIDVDTCTFMFDDALCLFSITSFQLMIELSRADSLINVQWLMVIVFVLFDRVRSFLLLSLISSDVSNEEETVPMSILFSWWKKIRKAARKLSFVKKTKENNAIWSPWSRIINEKLDQWEEDTAINLRRVLNLNGK